LAVVLFRKRRIRQSTIFQGTGDQMIDFPGGLIDPLPWGGMETPEAAASRELREESAGYISVPPADLLRNGSVTTVNRNGDAYTYFAINLRGLNNNAFQQQLSSHPHPPDTPFNEMDLLIHVPVQNLLAVNQGNGSSGGRPGTWVHDIRGQEHRLDGQAVDFLFRNPNPASGISPGRQFLTNIITALQRQGVLTC